MPCLYKPKQGHHIAILAQASADDDAFGLVNALALLMIVEARVKFIHLYIAAGRNASIQFSYSEVS